MPTAIISARPEQAGRDLAQMRELGINVVRIYHLAAALVSRSLRGRQGARPDHAPVGKTR